MNKLLTILFILICITANATTYYVSNSGSDSNNGTSEATPWQTIGKVNGFSSFNPGDFILFKKGDDWRETLTVPSSGSLGNPITFGSYGTGVIPRILGSNLATSWTNMGGNVWEASETFTDPAADASFPGTIYFTTFTDTTFGHVQKATTFDLVVQYDWCWVSGKISVYSTVDPAILYQQVEVGQRANVVHLNNKNYLVFENIELQFGKNSGIQGGSNLGKKGLTIQNFVISYIGVKGGGAAYGIQANYSDMTIQDGIVHSTGRRGISIGNMLAYDTIKNVRLQRLELFDGYHTTGFDIAGTGGGVVIDSVSILDNYVHDSTDKKITGSENYGSVLMFISNKATDGGYISNILINNNRFGYPSMTALQLEDVTNTIISGNTFLGTNTSITGGGIAIGWGGTATNGLTIKNNIFSGNSVTNNEAVGVFMGSTDSNLDMDYNLYFQDDPTKNIIDFFTNATKYTMATLGTFQSVSGQDAHSITGDPLLNSDFTLQSGSPAIGAGEGGINIGYISSTLPPTVDAGADTVIFLGSPVTLNGSVESAVGHTSTYLWTFESGSGTFDDATALNAVVSDLALGDNILRLTATQDDSQTGYGERKITVIEEPPPPEPSQKWPFKSKVILINSN